MNLNEILVVGMLKFFSQKKDGMGVNVYFDDRYCRQKTTQNTKVRPCHKISKIFWAHVIMEINLQLRVFG